MDATNHPLTPMPDDWKCGLAVVAHHDLEYGADRSRSYMIVTDGEAGCGGPDAAHPAP